jgi:hypothetical protein
MVGAAKLPAIGSSREKTMNILNKLSEALGGKTEMLNPQSKPAEPPSPVVDSTPAQYASLSYAGLMALLNFLDLPLPSFRKEQAVWGDSYEAMLREMSGMSYNDAVAEWKILNGKLRKGDLAADKMPRKADLIERNIYRRAEVRGKAGKISLKACNAAADILEKAKLGIPKYRAFIVQQEAMLFSGAPLDKSPLLKLVDQLPAFVDVHIAKLRANTLCNPRNLLR